MSRFANAGANQVWNNVRIFHDEHERHVPRTPVGNKHWRMLQFFCRMHVPWTPSGNQPSLGLIWNFRLCIQYSAVFRLESHCRASVVIVPPNARKFDRFFVATEKREYLLRSLNRTVGELIAECVCIKPRLRTKQQKRKKKGRKERKKKEKKARAKGRTKDSTQSRVVASKMKRIPKKYRR